MGLAGPCGPWGLCAGNRSLEVLLGWTSLPSSSGKEDTLRKMSSHKCFWKWDPSLHLRLTHASVCMNVCTGSEQVLQTLASCLSGSREGEFRMCVQMAEPEPHCHGLGVRSSSWQWSRTVRLGSEEEEGTQGPRSCGETTSRLQRLLGLLAPPVLGWVLALDRCLRCAWKREVRAGAQTSKCECGVGWRVMSALGWAPAPGPAILPSLGPVLPVPNSLLSSFSY